MPKKKEQGWHTRKWYKSNFGVDPLKLGLPPREVKNPHFSSAPPMKLWREEEVEPYRDEKKIEEHRKRVLAGKKAAATRRKNLMSFFDEARKKNPRVGEITKKLWQIGKKIGKLHNKKEACRERDDTYDRESYFEFGIQHCHSCAQMSRRQDRLRDEREHLFLELERICGKDKKTIQLARRYLREEKWGGDD